MSKVKVKEFGAAMLLLGWATDRDSANNRYWTKSTTNSVVRSGRNDIDIVARSPHNYFNISYEKALEVISAGV